jgi:hypothetical protein
MNQKVCRDPFRICFICSYWYSEAAGKEKQRAPVQHVDSAQPPIFTPSSLAELSSSALRSSDLSDLDELSEPLVVRRGGSSESVPPTTLGNTGSGPAAMLAASFANIPESIDTERYHLLSYSPALLSSPAANMYTGQVHTSQRTPLL